MAIHSVLHIGNFLSGYGYNRQFIEDFADKLDLSGWQVYRASSQRLRPIRLLDMLRIIWARRQDFAVGHIAVFSGLAFLWAEAAAWMFRRVNRPYVLSLHGGNLPEFSRRWPGRVRHLLTSAVYVMAPSHYLREALLPLYPTIRLLPNPIDIIHYPYRWRSDFQPRFIWLRAFHSIYNPRLAVEALAQLVGEYPEASLLMIGPDKGDGSLALAQQAAHALAVAPQVKFVGQVAKSAVPGWLSQGDIYLNTTNLDNTPISVMEAMACGLGIVSTNVSGIPYLLTAEQDSLLVPPKDPDALAQAIRRLLTEPGLGARLSANARAKAEQFDWSVILPQWIQILTAAIEGGHP